MGFSGGGSNVLKAHKHSSAVQDGGKLDMDNVTEAELTAGDIVYSDGSALQRLAIGTPAQQLKVNAGATAPEYFTPAAAASTWTTLADVTLGVAGTLDSGVFASHSVLTIYIFAALSASDGQGIKFNNDSAANQYCSRDFRNGTMFTTSNYACIQFGFVATTNWINSAWTITQRDATEKMINGFITEQTGTASTSHPSQDLMSAMYRDAVNPITRVTSTDSTGGTVNMQAGSRMVVLGSA